jgi:hypothetical protein
MYADMHDPGFIAAATAYPYLAAIEADARQMTVVLADDRRALLESCLRRAADLEQWNRVAMGKRFVSDDEIDIELAALRRALHHVAELSTAAYFPGRHAGRCPACLGPIETDPEFSWCVACYDLIRFSIERLSCYFGLTFL